MSSFVIFIFILFTVSGDTFAQNQTVTDDDEWKSYVQRIKSYMNNDLNPCDNFFEYVCGNYKNAVSIEQEENNNQGVQQQLQYQINNDVGNVLEANEEIDDSKVNKSENAFAIIKNEILETKRFYNSCMESGIFQLKKSEKYLDYIKNELGGWPAIDCNWTKENYDWFKVNVKINRFGSGPFLATDVLGTYKSDYYRRYFGLEKQRDFNKTSEIYQSNLKTMLQILKMYDVPDEKAKIIANEIMELGNQYDQDHKKSKCYLYRTDTDDLQKQLSDKIDDIQQMYDILPDKSLIIGFNIVWNGKLCIDNLYNFMKTADMRIVANYMAIYFLYLLHKTELSTFGNEKQKCTRKTRELFTPIPELMYINSKYYNPELETEVIDYIKYLVFAFQDSVNNRDWIDDRVKAEAYNKYDYMKFMIGRRSNIVDYSFIKFRFSRKDFNVTSDNYFENNMNLMLFKKVRDSIQLINRDMTFVSIDVNAYYVMDGNALQLPVSVLQKPIQSIKFPKAYNFGSLGGYIIGHEMAHAVDPVGQKYDASGVERQWFSISNREIFTKPVECFKKQYRDYLNQFNSTNTRKMFTGSRLNENVCDSIGLRQGYYAYKKWLKEERNCSSETIEDLNMTGDQLYFLSYAHINCVHQTKDDMLKILENPDNEHLPTVYRVTSSISNMEEFSKEFNCPKGSNMNPEEKCVLW